MAGNVNAGTFGFMLSRHFNCDFMHFVSRNQKTPEKRPKCRFFIRGFLVWRICLAYSHFTEKNLKYARGQNTPENGGYAKNTPKETAPSIYEKN